MRCSSCQIENQPEANFCYKCGTRLQAAPAPPAPTTASQTSGDKNITVQGNENNVVQYITQVFQTPGPQTLPQEEALRRYLGYLIDTHQHLRLQGIQAGSQPVSVDLEKVYVSLTIATRGGAHDHKPQRELDLAREGGGPLTLAKALQAYRRLVIIGDPGSGKTTLLAYLALTYARTLRDGEDKVQERLQLSESTHLPILLPLRDLGKHLRGSDDSKDGAATLLAYLQAYYAAQNIRVPDDFFAAPLERGQAVVLLDGMDELAETGLRQRVARLIEKFVIRYPQARYAVTSRKVGYEGAARVGAGFALAEVREFSPAEMRQFVRDWTRVVEVKLAERESVDILNAADQQAASLIRAIENNPRVQELAVNPLLLTVIALVHRYRAALPERRAELYEEAVEVLLGQWDEAKGLSTEITLASGRALDAGDRRSLLEPVAFWQHARQVRELEREDLRQILLPAFTSMSSGDKALAQKALDKFLHLINERSGLIVERGVGVYGFAHLTFQEYLAARAVADREDALAFTLEKLPDPWWREVILLQAGLLSTQSKRRVSELIRALLSADPQTEPEPCHHLALAAECLLDAGEARVEAGLQNEVKARIKAEAEVLMPGKNDKARREKILRKIHALNALSRLESGQGAGPTRFWKPPYGEPEWVTIPAGEFWMGSERYDDEKPVYVAEFQMAKVPVTNAQYALYLKDTNEPAPEDWSGQQPPKGKENHPVVNVSWRDAQAYCVWLSKKIQKLARLPTEAEWEKAARGDQDQRAYSWGDKWRELHCNSDELGLGDTSPVGIFANGASPYGVLDLAGNVWEWCQSKLKDYPYTADDGREVIDQSNDSRAVRGGSWYGNSDFARTAFRSGTVPDYRHFSFGFRVVVRPSSR